MEMIFHLSPYLHLEWPLGPPELVTVSLGHMTTPQMTPPQLTNCIPPSVSPQTMPHQQACSFTSLVATGRTLSLRLSRHPVRPLHLFPHTTKVLRGQTGRLAATAQKLQTRVQTASCAPPPPSCQECLLSLFSPAGIHPPPLASRDPNPS